MSVRYNGVSGTPPLPPKNKKKANLVKSLARLHLRFAIVLSGHSRVVLAHTHPPLPPSKSINTKAAVVKSLTWEDAFAIFGHSDIERLRKHYDVGGGCSGSSSSSSPLRAQLSPESQKFWDGRVHKDFSFMYSGTSGTAAWVLVRVLLPLLGLGFIRRFVQAGVSKVIGCFNFLFTPECIVRPGI